ncbi:MAG: hypothetical protein IJR41_04900 [Atopobiaceae bacterium]|nr:hypothetical protein [Atopobiaceae bacterium]
MDSLESFASAFFQQSAPVTSAYRGRLAFIGEDGVWHVYMNSSTPTRCVGFGDAEAGDMVLVIKHPNGHCSAIGGVSTGGGGGSGDKSYIHTQTTDAYVWNIAHYLGKRPSITIVDSGGNVVEGEESYIDENNVQVRFNVETRGQAYCN